MVLIDTNVLLYATGGAHPLREPCRGIVRAVGQSRLPACITDVVLAEFVHARARRSSRAEAAELAASFIAIVDEVVVPDPNVRDRALGLYATTDQLSSNDALIAAMAIEHGMTLLSADQDFVEARGLRLVAPDSDEARALIRS